MKPTRVLNLATGEEQLYTCGAYNAVIAAYAMEHNDFNTWIYNTRYCQLVREGKRTYSCGNWAVLKENAS